MATRAPNGVHLATGPETLSSRNNLAFAYHAAGRPAEAIPLYEQTLADRERILGPDHPDTLGSRNNLALAYRDAGRTDEAERIRTPGPADP
jgi:tetratricopeptide (TPR) repeat protein